MLSCREAPKQGIGIIERIDMASIAPRISLPRYSVIYGQRHPGTFKYSIFNVQHVFTPHAIAFRILTMPAFDVAFMSVTFMVIKCFARLFDMVGILTRGSERCELFPSAQPSPTIRYRPQHEQAPHFCSYVSLSHNRLLVKQLSTNHQ